MWDRFLCFFLGHDWRGLTRDEVNSCIERKDFAITVCVRCEATVYIRPDGQEEFRHAR